MFEDSKGNRYEPGDVIFLDIDTPGPQFMGYVSLESYKRTNCIEEFVRVRAVEGHKMEKVEKEGMSIAKGVKYRTPNRTA
ncbi:MAG: hypothetical protein GF334_09830 [Candidatus Altiarchaeales archaeon]|nr:hypothetical protein [Candidatus Altiarchaeales archaeon]